MALFQKTKDSPDAPSLPAPRLEAAPVVPGEAAAECMRVGQMLVEGEQLTAREPGDRAVGRERRPAAVRRHRARSFGVDRAELAKAVAEVTEVAAARHEGDRAARQRQGLPRREDRPRPLRDRHRRGGRNARRPRGRPVAPRRRAPSRPLPVDPCAGPSPTRPRSARSSTARYRADADIDRLVKAFEVGDDQSKAGGGRRRGQPRRPGPDRPARQPHRQPGDARPHVATSTSSRSTTSCASGSASTVTWSRRSACRSACTRR